MEKDSLPLKIIPELKKIFPKIEFLEFDVVEDLQDKGKNLVIIDSAEGIKKVCLITDFDALETAPITTMHDFDLAYTLKLMKKTGMIKTAKIFCIPTTMQKEKAIKQLVPLIKSTLF